VRFAGCQNHTGNLALRIVSLNMQGPRGSGDVLRSCLVLYLAPRRGRYRQDSASSLLRRRASRVALASTLVSTRSWIDGTLAPPCGLGGVGPCTDGALFGGCRSLGCLAHVSWDYDVELFVFCTIACSRRPQSPGRTLLPSGVDGSGIALRSSMAAIMSYLAMLETRGSSPRHPRRCVD